MYMYQRLVRVCAGTRSCFFYTRTFLVMVSHTSLPPQMVLVPLTVCRPPPSHWVTSTELRRSMPSCSWRPFEPSLKVHCIHDCTVLVIIHLKYLNVTCHGTHTVHVFIYSAFNVILGTNCSVYSQYVQVCALINNPFPFRQCGEWAGVSRTGGYQLCSADDQLPAAQENGSQTADSASSLGR